ncbi:helix-turn-helix domain-containing protein [Spirosoma sp. KNUC1025]|uniref:winged helix-turn-helix transcriptional regulator n=1 Tax=Spirosoma sp. KNUC1025 TaxID=2894082 RepID=UPI0038653C0C|nr:helix-turn-helix transcriptional regulator [Spirosoma sp. KNUC1025]
MTTSAFHERSSEPDPLLISHALSVICGKWRLYIILVLGEKTLRYSQLNDLLPGVSEKVLAGELKTLVTLGVLKRVMYSEIPPRVEYTLTEKGLLALPMLRQIQQIGQLFI